MSEVKQRRLGFKNINGQLSAWKQHRGTSRKCCNRFCHLQTVLLSTHVSLQDMHTPPRLHLPACLCKWTSCTGLLGKYTSVQSPFYGFGSPVHSHMLGHHLFTNLSAPAEAFLQLLSLCTASRGAGWQPSMKKKSTSTHATSEAGVFLRNQDVSVIPTAIPAPRDLQRTRSNFYKYFFFPPQLKEEPLVEVFQVPTRAFCGWFFMQVELQQEIEHGKCRQGDCCGQHRWAPGLILVPCSPAGYPALCCYIDRWREGWFARGHSVKGEY